MSDDTTHPHLPQLQQCREQFLAINETLNGNGHVGLKTAVYAIKLQLNDVSAQVGELRQQGKVVQQLIWIGFGVMFTANLFMNGNVTDIIRTILGSI